MLLPSAVRVTDSMGIRRLQFSDLLVQGVMKVDDPARLLLDYAHKMMVWIGFGLQPRAVLLIGLGAGAIVRFFLRHFPETALDAVEIDHRVIDICYEKFLLPKTDSRLKVHLADGLEFVPSAVRSGAKWDLILLDAYGEFGEHPGFGTTQFLHECATALDDQGILVMNTIGGPSVGEPHRESLVEVFGSNIRYMTPTPEGNIITLAGKNRSVNSSALVLAEDIIRLDLRTGLWAFQ